MSRIHNDDIESQLSKRKRNESSPGQYSSIPKYLAQGTYGCVHKPSMHCKRWKQSYNDSVSKIMTEHAANSEIGEYEKMTVVDPKNNYYLGLPHKCKPREKDLTQDYLHKCKTFMEGEDKKKSMLLIMKNGGMNLKDYTDSNELDKADLEILLVELYRMMMGIDALLKNNLVHHDLKGDNIVFNRDKKRMNFIDFGLMANINEVKNECRNMIWI